MRARFTWQWWIAIGFFAVALPLLGLAIWETVTASNDDVPSPWAPTTQEDGDG